MLKHTIIYSEVESMLIRTPGLFYFSSFEHINQLLVYSHNRWKETEKRGNKVKVSKKQK